MNTPISETNKSALLVAQEAATISGNYIQSRFNTEMKISFKGRTDIVTDVDTQSEKLAIDYLCLLYTSPSPRD